MKREDVRGGLLVDLAMLAEALCDIRQHVQVIREYCPVGKRTKERRAHVTIQDGLLQQLTEMFVARVRPIDEGAGRGLASEKTPCNLDALSRHTAITFGAAAWCWRLGIDQRADVEGNIRAMVGAAGTLDDPTLRALVGDVRRWHTWAATVTGWRSPPWTPNVPCPVDGCGRRQLRVNLTAQTALCAGCGETWDAMRIGTLADYVRWAQDQPTGV